MAADGLREELNCSICLSLYKEPMYLRCGHNFCQDCIVIVLDTQKGSGVYSCPECREEYKERPPLGRNRKLCNIVDNFRSAHQEDAEVFCTYCDSSVPATKTCLTCEASFCSKHLKKHSKSADHILTEPTTSFEERKCSIHKEILKYYCVMDNTCICMSCWVAGDHKGHQVELLNQASEKMIEKLRESANKLNSEIQETEKRIQNLKNHRTEEKEKTFVVTKRVSDLFGDIRKQLDDTEKRFLAEISRQEEEVSQSVSNLIQKLEEQKDELSRKINQMEKLCNTQDPITVLKKQLTEMTLMLHNGLLHFTDSLIDLKRKRQFSEMENSDILLDINTADNNIIISEDLKTATYSDTCQNRPEGPERFKSWQVLSTNSFTSGRHYWEVDVSGAEKWLTGVAAHSIERKINGNESWIGYNDKSWSLHVIETFGTMHNNIFKRLNSDSPVKSVGLYLDYEAGRLSFYQLCDPIRHLHTFTATFTEPLHAAFYLFKKCSIKIKK
uniref:Uncharacterized protein n=1 Tax=Pyxicephalus adspersus TaxID=30357 RepID=A0AAV2ZR74_PYXAD|nr:TPA: hypothetical protein GDO54_014989 [Pyxicephalus adspersus]